jgi:hypothetical protein
MAKFQTEEFGVKRCMKNEHLISDDVYPKRLLKFFIVYEFCLQCVVYARYLLRSRHVFHFKMLHRSYVLLYRYKHSQSNTQHIISINHGYMFWLHQGSPHQTVQNHKKEVIYIKGMGDILCSVCCGHNTVLISI